MVVGLFQNVRDFDERIFWQVFENRHTERSRGDADGEERKKDKL